MRDDVDFGRRISQKVKEIKENKENLGRIAGNYNERYKKEVADGTKLLSEGLSQGISESEIRQSYHGFLPTVQTPLLNFLYFLLRESDSDNYYGKTHYERRNRIDEYLIKHNQIEHTENHDASAEEIDKALDDLTREMYRETYSHNERQQVNKQFDKEKDTRTDEDETELKDTPDMVNYLYGAVSLETFNKIKKLKALSKSSNESEAFLAYRKALELCKEYGLEFDRIPCYVEPKKKS
jgi:hypothetical protein